MACEQKDSVTVWLASLKNGDAEAAQKLWSRYFEALVRLARDRLRGAPRAVADEEDAALSALDSFVRGAARGRYPRLDDRDDLWRLLVVITERKAIDQTQHERRQKRGGGKIIGTAGRPDVERADGSIVSAVSQEPTPEFAAAVADECRSLLGSLRDDSLRAVAVLRMEGCTNEEVAQRVGRSLRTVARKIELIRRSWLGEDAILSCKTRSDPFARNCRLCHDPRSILPRHASPVAESNLLFGLIALQNGLLDQKQLVNALRAWTSGGRHGPSPSTWSRGANSTRPTGPPLRRWRFGTCTSMGTTRRSARPHSGQAGRPAMAWRPSAAPISAIRSPMSVRSLPNLMATPTRTDHAMRSPRRRPAASDFKRGAPPRQGGIGGRTSWRWTPNCIARWRLSRSWIATPPTPPAVVGSSDSGPAPTSTAWAPRSTAC